MKFDFLKKLKFNFKLNLNKDLIGVYIGIFLISMAIITIEMALNRMFSLTFWYHFAFLIISIALFGIGLGGMLVYFINPLVKKQVHLSLYVLSLALAGAVVYALYTANSIPLETKILSDPNFKTNYSMHDLINGVFNGVAGIKDAKLKHMVYFIHTFLVLSIPFVFGGMIFSIIFTNFSKKIGKVYFADLVGGGLGCLVALWLFPGRGPILLSVVTAVIILAGAFFFMIFKYRWFIRIPILIIPILLIGYTLKEIYPKMENVQIRVSESKRDKGELKSYGQMVFSHWDNFSFVSVFFEKESFYRLTGDFATNTPILKLQGRKPADLMGSYKDQLYSFFVKKNPENVCIVGAGGGREVIMAKAMNAKNVYALEFNPTFHWLVSESKFRIFGGDISRLPGVQYIKGEGRFFIKSSDRKYDIILFNNAISQTAASSGAYSLSESYLYTVEGFIDYMKHLTPNGVLYLSNPFPDAPRFVTTLREAFKRMGIEEHFKDRIIVAWMPKAPYKTCKITIKNGDFTQQEIANIAAYMRQNEHSFLYGPHMNINTKEARLVTSNNLEKEYFLSDTEIRPSTDNWPFFTQRVKSENQNNKANELENVAGFYAQPFVMIKSMLESSVYMCIAFLILPLLILNIGELLIKLRNLIFHRYKEHEVKKLKNKFGSIFYFLALGMGFMFVEVIFMQKFILFLGHPIYAFSVVLATIMITSGIGSLISHKFDNKAFKGIAFAVTGIIVSIAINIFFFNFFSDSLISASFTMRVLISILLIGSAGVFMGFMMPLGINIVSRQTEAAIPWMWSINGTFSVLASFLSIYFSIVYGFTFVLAIGVVIYIIGAACFILKIKD